MGIDYSRQAGKKITTKGYTKKSVHIEDIMYIVRDGYLSTLFLNNGERIFEIESLREFERKLCDMGFFRIRDNTIINGKYITEANKKTVKLGKTAFSIAKRRLKLFYDWFL
jgi:DNA-binding LytR/AlgR family response regulator